MQMVDDVKPETKLTFDDFRKIQEKYPALFLPAFLLQDNLRKKVIFISILTISRSHGGFCFFCIDFGSGLVVSEAFFVFSSSKEDVKRGTQHRRNHTS